MAMTKEKKNYIQTKTKLKAPSLKVNILCFRPQGTENQLCGRHFECSKTEHGFSSPDMRSLQQRHQYFHLQRVQLQISCRASGAFNQVFTSIIPVMSNG